MFIRRPRPNYGKVSVRYAAAVFWNKTPLIITNAASFQRGQELKKYLLTIDA